MNHPRKFVLLIFAVLFTLGAPLSVIGMGVYAFFLPRVFQASTEFQLLRREVDAARIPDAFLKAQQQFPERMHQALTSRVELLQFGAAGQYRITATDESPLTAANTANLLTLLVRDNLSETGKDGEPPPNVLQLQQVVPARAFSIPGRNYLWMIAFSMAAISGVLAAIFFLLAFTKQPSPATVREAGPEA